MIYENIRSILVLAFQVVSKRDIYIYLSMPESLHCHICVLQFKLLYFYCLFKMFSEVKLSMQSIILKFTL